MPPALLPPDPSPQEVDLCSPGQAAKVPGFLSQPSVDLGSCRPPRVTIIAYDTIKGASSYLFCISKHIFLIKANCLFGVGGRGEKSPLLRENLMGRLGTKVDGYTIGPKSDPRLRHSLGLHVPPWWSFTLQSWSLGRSGMADLCPRQHANEPNTGIHWKQPIQPHLSSSDVECTCSPALVPPPTPTTRTVPESVCAAPKSCILTFSATQPLR